MAGRRQPKLASKVGVTSGLNNMASAVAPLHRAAAVGRFRAGNRRCSRLRKLSSPTKVENPTPLPSTSSRPRPRPASECSPGPAAGLGPRRGVIRGPDPIRPTVATTSTPGKSELSRRHRCGRSGQRGPRGCRRGSRYPAHEGDKM